MDGIAGIQSRIAAIEGRFGAPPAAIAPPQQRATLQSSAQLQAPGSFNDVYLNTFRATEPTTPARKLSPGAYGSLQPPAELVGYGNGRIPASAMVSLGQGDHRLHAPAARAFKQMDAAARAEGVELGIITSYRDLATQERLAVEKGLYSQGGLAARPGTSNHGWGLSIDLRLDAKAQAWMDQNGWKYGFVEDVPREPWHWTYRPAS